MLAEERADGVESCGFFRKPSKYRTAYDITMRPFQVVKYLQTFRLKAHGWTANKKGFPTWIMKSRKSDISSKLLTCMHIKLHDIGLFANQIIDFSYRGYL